MKFFCFEITYVGFGKLGYKWKKLAKQGLILDAIKMLRVEVNGDYPNQVPEGSPDYMDLRQAKNIVDTYMVQHGIERKFQV